MITITIYQQLLEKENYYLKKIIIIGHSFKKKDEKLAPLCLAVSSITLGVVNSFSHHFHSLKPLMIITSKKDGHLIFTAKQFHQAIETILMTMIGQLETVASYFKKGIKIKWEKLKN